MIIIGDGSGMSICVMHCGILYTVQIFGRTLHSISWTIDLSWKNFSILSRHSHNHGLPSMRTVLSIVRCDNSSTERQSRSLSRRSRVSSRGNVRKTSGSTCTKPHLKRECECTLCIMRVERARIYFSKLIKKNLENNRSRKINKKIERNIICRDARISRTKSLC